MVVPVHFKTVILPFGKGISSPEQIISISSIQSRWNNFNSLEPLIFESIFDRDLFFSLELLFKIKKLDIFNGLAKSNLRRKI
jgi:hypothetical protein